MKPFNHSYCEHCGFINWERLEPDLYLCNTSYNGYTVVASISADMAYGEFKYDVNILKPNPGPTNTKALILIFEGSTELLPLHTVRKLVQVQWEEAIDAIRH